MLPLAQSPILPDAGILSWHSSNKRKKAGGPIPSLRSHRSWSLLDRTDARADMLHRNLGWDVCMRSVQENLVLIARPLRSRGESGGRSHRAWGRSGGDRANHQGELPTLLPSSLRPRLSLSRPPFLLLRCRPSRLILIAPASKGADPLMQPSSSMISSHARDRTAAPAVDPRHPRRPPPHPAFSSSTVLSPGVGPAVLSMPLLPPRLTTTGFASSSKGCCSLSTTSSKRSWYRASAC